MMKEQAIATISTDWGLRIDGSFSKEQVLELLSLRVSKMLAGSSDDFFQLMYRLDIGEEKLSWALSAVDVPMEVAMLIWDRQMQKSESRARYSAPDVADDELKW